MFGVSPFTGKILIDPNITTEADPTALVEIKTTGKGVRGAL
ncbi:hypothetical protein N8586_05895 [Verrucomicrobiales bacterium]|nr:hypothetical protein [Verrucomicrobiales bacterium]MDA7614649.1 hypothetical protein [Verrucomicrobiales bacterium]